MVGGTGVDDTLLMQAVDGLLVKGGADGVHCAALPDGRSVALKIADGSDRARMPVLVGALRSLGLHERARAARDLLNDLAVGIRPGRRAAGRHRRDPPRSLLPDPFAPQHSPLQQCVHVSRSSPSRQRCPDDPETERSDPRPQPLATTTTPARKRPNPICRNCSRRRSRATTRVSSPGRSR